MAKTFRYQHLKTSTNGATPSSSVLKDAEIAVNIAAGGEKLFLKNSSGNVVKFITEDQIDAKIASGGGAIETKIEALSGAIDTLDSELAGKANTATTYTKTEVDGLLNGKADTATTYTKSEVDTALAGKANTATTYTKDDVDSLLAAKANTATTLAGYGITDAYTKAEADSAITNNIKDFFDGAEYDSATTRINFKHGSTVKAYIDASAFIKDGMVSNVEIKTVDGVTCLVITFNADSGKENINIPISDIFDATNYYTKAQIDAALSGKASTATTLAGYGITDAYTKTEVDTAIGAKADAATTLAGYGITDAYTKTEVDTALAAKADTATTYTKTEVDTAVGAKADAATTYTKTEVDTALAGKANTATTLSGYGITNAYTKTEVDTAIGAKADTATTYTKTEVDTALSGKQETLVSGTNIKTVANKTLLGSGNVEISITELSTSGVSDLTVDGDTIILDAGTF